MGLLDSAVGLLVGDAMLLVERFIAVGKGLCKPHWALFLPARRQQKARLLSAARGRNSCRRAGPHIHTGCGLNYLALLTSTDIDHAGRGYYQTSTSYVPELSF